ncbi:MAG: hypothetical protein EA384_06540 [Spirochaetaceae bacterium]|nr:MAG: hypothetical protein EA384_06540 [Spirochaetaceae bacterium]
MEKRLLLAGVLCLVVVTALSAGGWNEPGGGALLTSSDEWGVERLEAEIGGFDFEYRGGSGPATRIEVYGAADGRPVIQRDGALLTISLLDRVRLAAPRGRIVVLGPAMIDITVRSTAGSIALETIAAPELTAYSSSGGITVETVEADLDLRTDAGDITVIDSAGSKRIVTESGNIALSSSSGRMVLRSVSGRINLWDVTGALDVQTVSGAIDVVGLTLHDRGRVVTESGRIEVIFAHELDTLLFDLSSRSGKITVGEEIWSTEAGDPDSDEAEGRRPFVGISGSGHQYYR